MKGLIQKMDKPVPMKILFGTIFLLLATPAIVQTNESTVLDSQPPILIGDSLRAELAPIPDISYVEAPMVIVETEESEVESEVETETETEPVVQYHFNFTSNELQLLYEVVEAEVTTATYEAKQHVACVIVNRVLNEGFGSTLSEVLNEQQFSCIKDGRYLQVEITEDTINACQYALTSGDTTNGSLFFDSCHGNSWAAKNRVWVFNDGYHDFYR